MLPKKGRHLQSLHVQAEEAQFGREKGRPSETVDGEDDDRVCAWGGP